MPLRSSSIRAKITALLMVPIAALIGLWVYATMVTTGDVWSQLDASSTLRTLGPPTDQYALDLQAERRAAVLYLADPAITQNQDAYQQAQHVTDRDLTLLRASAVGSYAKLLDADQQHRYQAILTAAGELSGIRGQAGHQAASWDFVLRQYNALVQPVFSFRSSFASGTNGQLPREYIIQTELVRARDYLSQEDAAMEGLQRTPQPSDQMVQTALDSLDSQKALFSIYIPELDPQDQADYLNLGSGDSWSSLTAVENSFESAADRNAAVLSIANANWRPAADRTLGDLADLDARMSSDLAAQARSHAVEQLLRGGVAGTLGLLAVALSVIISFRISRGLVRQLLSLRSAAFELADSRLPSVMLRLRQGEVVDVAAEAPELDYGPAEIGQVGRAFNKVQRVALQAAVEQAELRRGVSAVFVNLARRSQALLHRQLTLLDAMERRTEDVQELEDLFRLDHLTTRMRRHAEGLIILSGGSPGRSWRRPVRMVDVVRAAVGEVEHYARVIVRPFPGTGLLGTAVADVTHLIAELVENACLFSPPHTQVIVKGEVVAHGFCVEIDDRGLGLSGPVLAEINERLAVEQEFDLADTDRLGLFVVSRLARRHGVNVHLQTSPYGGTSAVVLIPRELLAEAEAEQPRPKAPLAAIPDLAVIPDLAAVPEPAGDGGHRHAPDAEPARPAGHRSGGPRPSAPETGATPGGLPRRRVLGGAEGTGRHRRSGGPDDEGVPRTPAAAPADAAEPGRLPRRVRQAALAPQLKAATAQTPADRPARERSPEEARSTFASFQRGYRQGRDDRVPSASLTVIPQPTIPRPAVPRPAAPQPVGPPPPARPSGGPAGLVALPSVPPPPALPPAAAAVPAPLAPPEGTDSS